MPTTFTSASKAGRSIDVPTSACAARWKTTSASVSNGVADVVLQQRGGGVDVLAATRAEVVEHDHLVPARDEGVDEVGADEAGPAGDERAHRCSVESRPGRWSNVPAMFVSFEGLDGCGKTTQARLLAETLETEGVDVVSTREPGGTPLGEQIRDLVLHGDHVAPWAEAALYVAARAQHVDQVIRPALERGATVVCDRYLDTSVAYQGAGRELGVDTILELNLRAVGGLVPDRTFLVEIDTETALARVGEKGDRIERAGTEFWPRVVEAYRALAARYPERYVVDRRPALDLRDREGDP